MGQPAVRFIDAKQPLIQFEHAQDHALLFFNHLQFDGIGNTELLNLTVNLQS